MLADRIFNSRQFAPILPTKCHTIQIEFINCEILVSTEKKSNLLSSHMTHIYVHIARVSVVAAPSKMVHLIVMFVEINMCHLRLRGGGECVLYMV